MAIRAKLVIIFFVFAILPMFLLTERWYGTAREGMTFVLRRNLVTRAEEIDTQITNTIKQHQAAVSELAVRAVFKTFARSLTGSGQARPDAPLRQDLGAFLLAHQPQYQALICAGRDGRPLFKIESDAESVPRAYFTDKEFAAEETRHFAEAFQASSDATVWVSDAESEAGGPRLYLVTPLRNEAGQAVAALIFKLRADQLLREAAGQHSIASSAPPAKPKSRQAVILDHREQVLYAADPARQGRLFADAFRPFGTHLTAILGGTPDAQDIYSIKDLNEEWMIHAHRYPGSPRLLIVMLGKYGETINSIEGTAVTMVVLTFVLAIAATLLLYYFIGSATISIQRVTRGAKAIAAGNLDYQIQVKSNDETRVLADAFNRMAARLKEMIARESEQKQFESFARLSAVLTHDLKNAILSLSLLVSNMERKFDREGFREDAMLTLSESVAHLQGLVTKLSDPLAQTRSERQMEDLSAIAERVLQRTAEQAGERYQITTALAPQTKAAVDAKAIERVVENLVINAIQAMPGGGQLRVSTRRENDQAMLTVADTGKGMSEEFMRDRLFHPFATTKKKGIGLGLYSCREIVEQHGGRIEVTSRVDEGTEFRVVLPLATGEAKEREEQEMQVGS